MLWFNKKNGISYIVLEKGIINCTNSADGEVMYLYRPLYDPSIHYTRTESEFLEKFVEAPMVDRQILDRLYERDEQLLALEASGVDNWSGYPHAKELMKKLAEGKKLWQ